MHVVVLSALSLPLAPPLSFPFFTLQYIDIVTFLHLGFNNLRCIPKFGTKAKYNLRILNLRNNQLENIDGKYI